MPQSTTTTIDPMTISQATSRSRKLSYEITKRDSFGEVYPENVLLTISHDNITECTMPLDEFGRLDSLDLSIIEEKIIIDNESMQFMLIRVTDRDISSVRFFNSLTKARYAMQIAFCCALGKPYSLELFEELGRDDGLDYIGKNCAYTNGEENDWKIFAVMQTDKSQIAVELPD